MGTLVQFSISVWRGMRYVTLDVDAELTDDDSHVRAYKLKCLGDNSYLDDLSVHEIQELDRMAIAHFNAENVT